MTAEVKVASYDPASCEGCAADAKDLFPKQGSTHKWKYPRHPNYFGDAVFWWGIYGAVVAATPEAIWTIFAPILMNYLLVNVSGAEMLERRLKKKTGYTEYTQRTNRFVPKVW